MGQAEDDAALEAALRAGDALRKGQADAADRAAELVEARRVQEEARRRESN